MSLHLIQEAMTQLETLERELKRLVDRSILHRRRVHLGTMHTKAGDVVVWLEAGPAHKPNTIAEITAAGEDDSVPDPKAAIKRNPRDETGGDGPKFMECPTCAAKPGSPVLCVACLNNRSLIATLRQDLINALAQWEKYGDA